MILPYILNTICWINVTPGILVPCDPIIDVKIYLCWCDLIYNLKYWDRYSKQCRPRSEAAECNNPKYWDRYSKQCRPRSEAAECNNPKYWDRYMFAKTYLSQYLGLLHSAASDLGRHCLQRHICPNTYGYYILWHLIWVYTVWKGI